MKTFEKQFKEYFNEFYTLNELNLAKKTGICPRDNSRLDPQEVFYSEVQEKWARIYTCNKCKNYIEITSKDIFELILYGFNK